MKRNMINKITDRIEKIKVWISNKKPSNKYLRIAYYSLTGFISFMFMSLIAVAFISSVIAAVLWLLKCLINYSFVRIIVALLVCLMFLITFSLIGYFEFRED